jgi:hypothetical protein
MAHKGYTLQLLKVWSHLLVGPSACLRFHSAPKARTASRNLRSPVMSACLRLSPQWDSNVRTSSFADA